MVSSFHIIFFQMENITFGVKVSKIPTHYNICYNMVSIFVIPLESLLSLLGIKNEKQLVFDHNFTKNETRPHIEWAGPTSKNAPNQMSASNRLNLSSAAQLL